MTENKKKPTQEELGMLFHILIILNDRGGTRKSTFLIMLLGMLIMAERKARGIEIDDQGRVGRLFGERVQTLTLPPAEALSKSSAADTGVLAPLLTAMVKPDPGCPLIIEIGANLSDRVATVLMANQMGRNAERAGCRIGLLTMVDGTDDALALGAYSAQLFKAALPQAEIIVVQPSDDLGIDPTLPGMSEKARTGYLEVIQPAIAADRKIVWPMLAKDALRAFEKLRLTPGGFVDATPQQVGAAGYDATLMGFTADAEALHWIGMRFQSDFEIHLAELMQEVQRKLGFPLGEEVAPG